jgi:hypothetical protein
MKTIRRSTNTSRDVACGHILTRAWLQMTSSQEAWGAKMGFDAIEEDAESSRSY